MNFPVKAIVQSRLIQGNLYQFMDGVFLEENHT